MPDDNRVRDDTVPSAHAPARERSFVADGAMWTVRVRIAVYDRRRSDLVFESDHAIRRVRDYPDRWHELSDEELFALSFGR